LGLDREKFEWLLSKGLRHGGSTHSVDDVIAGLRSGELQSFYNDDGMIMTMTANYPQKKVLEMFMALGNQDAISSLFDKEVVNYGQEIGADYVRAIVRPGLVDLFKSLEGKPRGTIMYRALGAEV
jgi:hypothetical protein